MANPGEPAPARGAIIASLVAAEAATPEHDRFCFDLVLSSMGGVAPPGGDDGSEFVCDTGDGGWRLAVKILEPDVTRCWGLIGQTTHLPDVGEHRNIRHVGILVVAHFAIFVERAPPGSTLTGRHLHSKMAVVDWHGDHTVHLRFGVWSHVSCEFFHNSSTPGANPFTVLLLSDLPPAAGSRAREALLHLGLVEADVARMINPAGMSVSHRIGWVTRTIFDRRAEFAACQHCGAMAALALGVMC